MGNAWFVSPLTAEWAEPLQREGFSMPEDGVASTAPAPNQVFDVLEQLPEYRVRIRRRDRKEKGQAVYIELRREDDSYAIDIHLLRVNADDQPAGVFVFSYYRETEELIRLVSRLTKVCGPLVLWNDSDPDEAILVRPNEDMEA